MRGHTGHSKCQEPKFVLRILLFSVSEVSIIIMYFSQNSLCFFYCSYILVSDVFSHRTCIARSYVERNPVRSKGQQVRNCRQSGTITARFPEFDFWFLWMAPVTSAMCGVNDLSFGGASAWKIYRHRRYPTWLRWCLGTSHAGIPNVTAIPKEAIVIM